MQILRTDAGAIKPCLDETFFLACLWTNSLGGVGKELKTVPLDWSPGLVASSRQKQLLSQSDVATWLEIYFNVDALYDMASTKSRLSEI